MCPLRKVRNGLCRGSRSFARGPARTMSFDALCSSLFWPFPSRLLCMQDRTSAGSAGMPPPSPLGREACAQGSQGASRGLVRGPRERSGTRFEAYQSWSAARYITISPLARGPARTRSFDASRCLSMPCIVLSFGFPCLFEWRSNCYRESL